MSFKDIYGHSQNLQILKNALKQDSVAHAYLFSGPEGVGKMEVAEAFIQALLCLNQGDIDSCGECLSCQKVLTGKHPDVYRILAEGSRIKIDQIRELQKTFYYKPIEGASKIYLIDKADTMTIEAANSLLKILEEPPIETVFILITSKPYAMLPTILSRCQRIYFQKLANEEIEQLLVERFQLSRERASFLASLADGSIKKGESLVFSDEILDNRRETINLIRLVAQRDKVPLIKINNEWEKRREDFPLLLDFICLFFRDFLVWQETENINLIINKDELEFIKEMVVKYKLIDLTKILEELERLKRYLNQNVNYRVILDNLFLIIKV